MSSSDLKRSFADLAKRCEKVGWRVKLAGNGHTHIITHAGKGNSFPSSTTSTRGFQNAYRWAVRHGLLALEQRQQEEQQAKRDRRLNDINHEITQLEAMMPRSVSEVSNTSTKQEVNGEQVVERTPATITTPISRGPKPMKTVDEILLADGTVLYQCIIDNCWTTFTNARSVVTHQSALPLHKDARQTRKGESMGKSVASQHKVVERIVKEKEKKEEEDDPPKKKPRNTNTTTITERQKILGTIARLEGVVAALREIVENSDILKARNDSDILAKAEAYDRLKEQFQL